MTNIRQLTRWAIVPAVALALSIGLSVVPDTTAANAQQCPTNYNGDTGTYTYGACSPTDVQGMYTTPTTAYPYGYYPYSAYPYSTGYNPYTYTYNPYATYNPYTYTYNPYAYNGYNPYASLTYGYGSPYGYSSPYNYYGYSSYNYSPYSWIGAYGYGGSDSLYCFPC